MKIKVANKSYDEVMAIKESITSKRKKPKKHLHANAYSSFVDNHNQGNNPHERILRSNGTALHYDFTIAILFCIWQDPIHHKD